MSAELEEKILEMIELLRKESNAASLRSGGEASALFTARLAAEWAEVYRRLTAV